VTTALTDRMSTSMRIAIRQRAEALASLRRSGGVAILTAGCLVLYLVHAIYAQINYRTTAYDLGIFDQAVRAYAHFKAPMVPLKGAGYNVLGDHFHPIIAVLAPLYWIWDDPIMLLIAQAVLVAASIPVVYRFTRRRAGHGMSLVIAGAYGLGWPVQALIDFDFHEIAFATPLLALAVDALDRRDDRRLLIWAGLLLLVREDMGAVVFLLAVLRVVQRRRPHWPAAVLAVAGAVAYVLTTTVVIPHFAAGHGFAYGGHRWRCCRSARGTRCWPSRCWPSGSSTPGRTCGSRTSTTTRCPGLCSCWRWSTVPRGSACSATRSRRGGCAWR